MTNKTALALFDFDGTITSKDTLFHFTRFAVGTPRFLKGLMVISPVLVLFKLGLIKNQRTKELFLSFFFRGWSEKSFNTLARQYALTQIDKIVRPEARTRLEWHKEQGHTIVVVSASPENWLRPWCRKNGLLLIGSQLETENGCLSGRLAGKNCYGTEKVTRLKMKIEVSAYTPVFAYGDSRGDKEMLALADEAYFKYNKI